MKWEYKRLALLRSEPPIMDGSRLVSMGHLELHVDEDEWNALGADGWELVAVVGNGTLALFKRPVGDGEPREGRG